MIVTSMREVQLKVKFQVPAGTELQKLEKKSTVSYIYIGKPSADMRAMMGNRTRIQLNDRYAEPEEIVGFVRAERDRMAPEDVQNMRVSIKADKGTRMSVITDVKQMLRRAHALNINYSAEKKK